MLAANEVVWPERTWRDHFLNKLGLIGPDTDDGTLVHWARGLENSLGDTFHEQGLSHDWLVDHFKGYRAMLQMQQEIANVREVEVKIEVQPKADITEVPKAESAVDTVVSKPSRPARATRPGFGSPSPRPETLDPDVSGQQAQSETNPPARKERPQMPEFLRIADEQRRGGKKVKVTVENRTEGGSPVTAAPPPELVAQAAMMMNPPTHLVDAPARTRRPSRTPRPGFGLPRQKTETPPGALNKPEISPKYREVDVLKPALEPTKTPEVSVERMSKPEPGVVVPKVEQALASEICGNRKFPRKEAVSLAEDVVRYSKIRDLVQTVNDMQLSPDDRNKIEGDVKLAVGKTTFNAWMTIEFNSDRQVKSVVFDHWEYGEDRPVRFSQLHQVDGEFKKADPKKPLVGTPTMTIKQGEPVRPPKAKQAQALAAPQLKSPNPGLRRPEDRQKKSVGGMKR